MAQPAVGDVFDEARGLLNDIGAAVFTNTVLTPFAKIAYRDLQLHFMHNNLPVEKEVYSNTTIAALATTMTSPADMVEPVNMYERAVGSTDNFVEMIQRDWEPQLQQTDHLRFWVWREEEIKFLGSTAAREVRLQYIKGLGAVDWTVVGGKVPVQQADAYLGPRIAELASMFIGNNIDRANQCAQKADEGLELLLSIAIKNIQVLPVKRIPYRGKRKAVYSRIPRV